MTGTISYVERFRRRLRGWFLRAVIRRREVLCSSPLMPEWARSELREAIRQRDAEQDFARALPFGYVLEEGRVMRRSVQVSRWGLCTVWCCEPLEVC